MKRKIEQTGKTLPRVEDTGRPYERIDPALVAKRLGAEQVAARAEFPDRPAALLALRRALGRLLSR